MGTDGLVLRTKLAEALRRNGLNERAVAAEVLLLLPGEFLDQYEDLWLRVWPIGSSVRVGDPDSENPVATKWRTSTSQTETRGTASPKGAGSTSKGLGVRDAKAAATKDWADRKLRKLAREIKMRMTDTDASLRRCAGKCKRLAEDTWNYCPHCGAPTEEWDGPT